MLSFFSIGHLIRRAQTLTVSSPATVRRPLERGFLANFAILMEAVALMSLPPATQYDRAENRFGRATTHY